MKNLYETSMIKFYHENRKMSFEDIKKNLEAKKTLSPYNEDIEAYYSVKLANEKLGKKKPVGYYPIIRTIKGEELRIATNNQLSSEEKRARVEKLYVEIYKAVSDTMYIQTKEHFIKEVEYGKATVRLDIPKLYMKDFIKNQKIKSELKAKTFVVKFKGQIYDEKVTAWVYYHFSDEQIRNLKKAKTQGGILEIRCTKASFSLVENSYFRYEFEI